MSFFTGPPVRKSYLADTRGGKVENQSETGYKSYSNKDKIT